MHSLVAGSNFGPLVHAGPKDHGSRSRNLESVIHRVRKIGARSTFVWTSVDHGPGPYTP